MFVLHQNSPGVDVDDADGVPSTGRHQTGRLGGIIWVRLEHNLQFYFNFSYQFVMRRKLGSHLPDLGLNIGWIVVLTVASDEMDRIVVEASHVFTFMLFTGIFRTFTLRPLFIRHFEIFLNSLSD